MRGMVFVSGLFLIAVGALPTVHAQNQPAPVGVVGVDSPAPVSQPELTADYPQDQAGVLIKGARWTAVKSENPTQTKVGRGWAASLSYGAVPAKILAEYAGEHASTQVETGQPVLCACHFISLPGDPVLVRLHPKKGARELDGGRMVVLPVVGGSKMADANKSDLIPVVVSHSDPQVWLIRPQALLPPGEYALMLGTQNVSIFPFTLVAPAVHPSGAN